MAVFSFFFFSVRVKYAKVIISAIS